MIKIFKIFENYTQKHDIVLDDLIDYAKNEPQIIYDFIEDFIEDIYLNKNVIEFHCERCYEHMEQKTYTINVHQKHIGIITGIAYNFDEDEKKIFLSVYLNNIEYDHKVNTKKPLIIYGQIPDNVQKILNELEFFNDIKNYNL